ncbi:MAG: AAA ATPase [uncultured bacterium]|nr:MAG: AAA ATPase [uncultured bacterium]
MYRKFYCLDKRPFELAPVGGLVYLSDAHREGLAILRYGIVADKGVLLLTGGVGAGKTTLLNTLLNMLQDGIEVCLLNNPRMTRIEFFYYLGAKLGISGNVNKSQFILEFSELLGKFQAEKKKLLLIIDEAQASPINLLEEIRLLSNHAGERNVFSIFLIGQPELREKLASPQLLPLRQRIGVSYHLEPLTREETSQYIVYRLKMAGAAKTSIFTEKAIDCIYEASRGTPRLINVICDHAMVLGFTREISLIDQASIIECLEAVGLQGEKRLQVSRPEDSSSGTTALEMGNYRKAKVALFITLALIGAGGVIYFDHLRRWLAGIY